MKRIFETTRGSVQGAKHARAGGNNQDASHLLVSDDALIAVVCDGCSSGADAASHNDVGAQIGARILARVIAAELKRHRHVDWVWVRRLMVLELDRLRSLLMVDGDTRAPVLDYMLFTTLALVVTDHKAEVATIGDGVVIINGAPVALKAVVKAAPEYIAYTLTTRATRPVEFEIVASLPTEELESFFLGTDGCNDLSAAAERVIPGRDELVGPISQFWENDVFYGENHGDALRRRLGLANGGVWKDRAGGEVWKRAGLLPDDTTCIVGRRVRPASTSTPVAS